MSSGQDRWATAISMALVLGALLACKKKTEAEPEAAPTAAATPAAPATTTAAAATAAPAPSAAPAPEPAAPKLGDVKRYPESEKRGDEAAVKILEDAVKVFNEADNTTPVVATLPKDLAVVRLASLEKEAFTLVDFPSGIGQFSPGWVETKFLEAKGEQVARDKVLAQDKKAAIQPTTSPAASSSAKAAASSSAKPAASATGTATAATPAPTVTVPKEVTDLGKKASDLAKSAGIVLPPPPPPAKKK